MKPKILKIIKYDYFSSLLFIIAIVVTLLFAAIIAVGSGIGIVIIIALVSYTLLVLRVFLVRKDIYRLKDSKIMGTVHRFDRNNGNFYIVINYEVNTRSLGKRFPVLAGPVLRAKLRKLKDVELLVDIDKPKRVYIAQFFY